MAVVGEGRKAPCTAVIGGGKIKFWRRFAAFLDYVLTPLAERVV
jgi:hypothetical protein